MTDRLTISLSPQHWNMIMGLLGNQPYVAVQGIITEIQQQVAMINAKQQAAGSTQAHPLAEHPRDFPPLPNGSDFILPAQPDTPQ